MLDSVKESIINAYEIKTGLPRKELSRMMEEETWMDAAKAIELGFADGMLERNGHGHAVVNNASGTGTRAPLLFSQRTVDRALVNKLAPCVSVQPLYDRLERLRERNT